MTVIIIIPWDNELCKRDKSDFYDICIDVLKHSEAFLTSKKLMKVKKIALLP